MNSSAPGGVDFFLANGLWHWMVLFTLSVIGAAVAHGLFQVPLQSAVDVILSLQLLFIALWVLAIGLSLLEAILVTQYFGVIGKCLFGLIVCALLPFSSVAGFIAYSAVTGSEITDATFVYAPLVSSYFRALLSLGLVPDQLQDPTVLELVPLDGATRQPSTASIVIQIYLILLSFLLSLLATFLLRRRKRERAIQWPNS